MSAPRSAPLFKLGHILATPGAIEVTNLDQRTDYLGRHVRGDFGSVRGDDAEFNRAAIRNGDRILSAYPIDPSKPCQGFGDNCVWIITEADRSVTTFLLPEDY